MAEHTLRQARRKPKALPPEWQVGDAALGAHGPPRCRHDLKAAVQQEGMDFRSATVETLGYDHFAHRLSRR